MVAGDEDHLDLADRRSEVLEERAGGGERRAERAFAQLDDVAEQDDAVGAAQLREEDRADLGVAQDVPPLAAPR